MRQPARRAVADPTAIARIKDAIDLREYAGQWIKLRPQGRDLLGLCPFHHEDTPSFVVHATYFHCFGCGVGGDVFRFVQLIDGVTFEAALRSLSDHTGIPLTMVDARTAQRRQIYARVERERVHDYFFGRNAADAHQIAVFHFLAIAAECNHLAGSMLKLARPCDTEGLLWRVRRQKQQAYDLLMLVAAANARAPLPALQTLEDAYLQDLEQTAHLEYLIQSATPDALVAAYRELSRS